MKIKMGTDEKILYTVNYILLTIFAIMFLYPIVYVFSAAVSNPYLVETGSVVLFPKGFNLNSFKSAMELTGMWRAYGNSIFITAVGTVVSMVFTISGAYVLSKPELKFRKFWTFMVIVTMWFDPGMIPKYLNFRDLGLIDSYTGVILGFAINTFNVIILKSFFEAVPKSLEEAARIDGANKFSQLRHITIPAIIPTIVIMLVLKVGSMLNVAFETVLLLYQPATYSTADVISTYVYRTGMLMQDFGLATAVGLFNALVGFILVILLNS